MNDSLIKDLTNAQMPLYTALSGFVNKTNYVNIGVITKVHNENYVDVNLYYTDSAGAPAFIQAVRLLHIGTTKCKLLITPAVGDNVLLLCPRDFVEKLEYNRVPQKGKSCYLPYGNINMCGILIKDEGDDNVKTLVTVDENGTVNFKTKGDFSASFVKDDDDETVRTTMNINDEGAISITTEGSTTLESKGDVVVKTEGDAKVTASNVVAMCSSFKVQADENASAVFEVTP